MSDDKYAPIVQKLRSPATVFYEYAADDGALLLEAANEVERLTNKLNADSQNFQIECQKAEIEMLRANLASARAKRDDARGTVRHLEAELRVAKSHAASDRRSATDERLKAERLTAERDGLLDRMESIRALAQRIIKRNQGGSINDWEDNLTIRDIARAALAAMPEEDDDGR